MPRRVAWFFLSLTLWCGGCDLSEPEGPVEVRIMNGAQVTIDQGILYLPLESILIKNLEPGAATPYREVEKAYRIASAWLVAGSDTAGLQVVDFVGEEPLEPGRYTYALRFFQDDLDLPFLELEKDR